MSWLKNALKKLFQQSLYENTLSEEQRMEKMLENIRKKAQSNAKGTIAKFTNSSYEEPPQLNYENSSEIPLEESIKELETLVENSIAYFQVGNINAAVESFRMAKRLKSMIRTAPAARGTDARYQIDEIMVNNNEQPMHVNDMPSTEEEILATFYMRNSLAENRKNSNAAQYNDKDDEPRINML